MPKQITNTNSVQQESGSASFVWPGIITGFTAAIAMWLVWYPLHLPGLQLSPTITAPILLLVMITMIARGARLLGTKALLGGLIAGLTCSLINLLLLGNTLTEKDPVTAEMTLRENAPLIAGGFFLVSFIAGTIAGFIGRQLSKNATRTHQNWLVRFGIAAVAALVPLVAIGGAVTSAGAGMAVPDWPGTYGQNMFLYPISLMENSVDSRIFLEHTHRLFGALAGLTFLTLLIFTLLKKSTSITQAPTLIVFGMICVQGLLGGFRVFDNNPGFGVVHGLLGQIVLAAAVILVATYTQSWKDKLAVNMNTTRAARKWADIGVVVLFVQLAFAAAYRHMGSGHALMSHLGFSLIALTTTVILAFSMMKIDRDSGGSKTFKRLGMFLLHGVSLQMILGILSFFLLQDDAGSDRVVMSEDLADAANIPVAGVLIATAHQALGASLLTCAILSNIWTRRVRAKD